MRKLFRVLLAALALTILAPAAPAQATERARVCREHNGPDGPGGLQVTVCVQVDENFFNGLRAKIDWEYNQDIGIFTHIQVARPDTSAADGIELRRGGHWGGVANTITKQSTTGGFISMGEYSNAHTGYWDQCDPSLSNNLDYRSTAQYRLKFTFHAGQPTSVWFDLNSTEIQVFQPDDC
jgi:hypothetical protein